MPSVILITGCSSGIGRALAVEYAGRGHHVFASARRLEALKDLPLSVERLQLDVTDAASIDGAARRLTAEAGGVDVLINNAGYGLMGPAVEIPLDEVRRQFETNVMGPLALIQALALGMTTKGRGLVVNIGSVSGVAATPFAGPYCASKAALHLLSDALRMELAPFGVRVVTVQPGGIESRFGDTAFSQAKGLLRPGSLYRNALAVLEARARLSQEKPSPAEDFARDLVDILQRENPPALIRLGHGSRLLPFLKGSLPTASFDRMMRKRFGLERPADPSV